MIGSAERVSPTDADLMELASGGDVLAFETLYDRHARRAFSLAARITGDRASAEEATQEAFLGVWRSAGRYDRARGDARTWILAMVRNRAIDLLRRKGRSSKDVPMDLGTMELAGAQHTEEEALERIEARRLRDLVAGLPVGRRATIELAYFEGLSQAEIAAKLGLPLGTVKSRQRVALAQMRGALEARAPAEELGALLPALGA